MTKRVTLQTQYWHYTCGDGCCDEYGQKLLVNGEEVNADVHEDPHDAIEKVLKHLGYEVDWEELEDERTDLRMNWDDSDD